MKNVICYKTHMLSRRVLREFKRLSAECQSSACDVVLLYDNTRGDFVSSVGDRYFLFSAEDYKKAGYRLHEELQATWYNTDYPLVCFFRKNPGYDHYWMIEYDVRFKGAWPFFFDAFKNNDSDLLATWVQSPNDDPQWCWWGKHNLDVKNQVQRGIFFPVTRFSNRALRLLDEQYRAGRWGYCEVVGPTLLNAHGYKISDLGAAFYDRKTFRGASVIPLPPVLLLPKNKLYHPVGRNRLSEIIKDWLLPPAVKKWLKKMLGRK